MIPTGFLPMLADPAKKLAQLKFPLWASPKLDGVRAHVFGGVVYSRKLKPIPNQFLQSIFGVPELEGFDGELIVGPATAPDAYRKTMSGVMSVAGEPHVMFHVFDLVREIKQVGKGWGESEPWNKRYNELKKRKIAVARKARWSTCMLEMVPHKEINNLEELKAYEEECLERGFEGIMVRAAFGPYKCGRSTEKEGYLLKVKQFMDSEAEVLGVEELEHNMNEATTNELGRTKRSSHKAGKVAGGKLGALVVRDTKSGVEFNIGGGFTDADRTALWVQHAAGNLVGTLVKYKYFPTGNKEKPRFPTYLGPRSRDDL